MTTRFQYGLINLLIILTINILMPSCNTSSNTTQYDDFALSKPISQKQLNSYQKHLTDLNNELTHLKSQVEKASSVEAQLQSLCKVRQAFQHVGILLEYLDAQLYNLINGAPVIKEDHSMAGNQVVQPRGLQVIAEMIESYADTDAIIAEIEFVESQLTFYKNWLTKQELNQQDLMNAAYFSSIRMETLTLAGFDGLDDNCSLEELNVQLKMIYDYVGHQLNLNDFLFRDFTIFEFEHKQVSIARITKIRNEIAQQVRLKNLNQPINTTVGNIYNPNFLNPNFYGEAPLVATKNPTKVKLGKLLFNDVRLSQTKKMSCATCHIEDKAFTDGLKLSASNFSGQSLKRNTPSINYSGLQTRQLYDGSAQSIEDQVLHVINNESEFQFSVNEILELLREDSIYQNLFNELYKDQAQAINLNSLTNALAAYVNSLAKYKSDWDRLAKIESIVRIEDEAVVNGFNLFMGKAQCGTCHFPPNFSGLLPPFYSDSEFENIGVPMIVDSIWQVDNDLGRFEHYNNQAFKHFFKTPSLRNVAETAPYMHNGAFQTLEEVMDFYNNGGGVGHGLSYVNQTLPSDSLGLTDKEIEDVIAFMKALTD